MNYSRLNSFAKHKFVAHKQKPGCISQIIQKSCYIRPAYAPEIYHLITGTNDCTRCVRYGF